VSALGMPEISLRTTAGQIDHRLRIASVNTLIVVLGSATATLVCVLIARNLTGGEKRIERRLERLYSLQDPQFARELGVLLGPPFVEGNRCTYLRNGDEIFPSMLASIRAARNSITFETYIYWSGDIGQQFADALSERARAGVKVHILLDWLGSAKMKAELIAEMSGSGVDVRRFHALRWFELGRLNNRTHRKLLVVDGTIGFTGGVGIAPEWTGNGQDPNHWRDSHFRFEGPVVAQIQSVFLDNWIKASGEVLHGLDYFPSLLNSGTSWAQMFSSSPTGGSESMELMYLLAITSAQSSIDLAAAYFVPGNLALEALAQALRRGVRVRIVVPGKHIDSEMVRNASRARWGKLLALGATIAEYRPTMYHCKVMIVDGLLVSVGSTNFDNRSFRLNDEATLNVLDNDFAQAQTRAFEDDMKVSDVMSFDAWRRRPLREKMVEKVASVFRKQL
jgi:cardiolipin synthase